MNRIGVHYTQVLDFVRGINFHRGIQCDGVFTHFATADEPSGWDYKLQCQRFTEAVQAIKDAGFECGIVHCANTPSSMLDPSMHFDMIRAGVGLYGMQPCELSGRVMQLDPVMSVHARVTRVAHPAMGEGVGYGFTYRVPRTRVQICTLPIGYADGLSRTLSNRMDVLYRGERVHQVGNICMDQFMVAIQSNPAHEIPEDYLADETFAAILKEAEKYLGFPYVWGGSSPSTSFDCSGFVSYVYNQCGWDFGRLGAQGLYNISTRTSSPKPGDLVFFTGTYDTPGISHVGIYVGDGWMLHCGDPISYANLNTSYWQSHFYAYGKLF